VTWSPSEIPDCTGKTALVTGANSGIGFEAARLLAGKGATVVLGCRSEPRGRDALQRIAASVPSARVEMLLVDLASLASIREAAARFGERHDRLDVLCNNAGVMAIPRTLSEDGFELQLAVNHLGPFALTGLLLSKLLAAPAARVVAVSSLVHRAARLRLDDLDSARRYRKWEAYAQSKLANLLFAYELQRKLARSGARAISVACHPGYSDTNLQQVGPALEGSRLRSVLFRASNRLFAQSSEKGAWPIVYAATAPGVAGGDYIGPSGPGEMFGAPVEVRSSGTSHDPELARALWSASVERTGVDYGLLCGKARASPGGRVS
jgi:NAD(P)-dependent dehydrogenase (short-subunit alcohol dehydrogenase family)